MCVYIYIEIYIYIYIYREREREREMNKYKSRTDSTSRWLIGQPHVALIQNSSTTKLYIDMDMYISHRLYVEV